MIKIVYFVLCASLTTQVWSGNPQLESEHDSPKVICAEIQNWANESFDQFTACSNLSAQRFATQIFLNVCLDAYHSFINQEPRAKQHCEHEVKVATETTIVAGDDIIGAVAVGSSPLPEHTSTVTSHEMQSCQEKDLSLFACTLNSSIVIPDLTAIMKFPGVIPSMGVSTATPAEYTKSKCDCFEKSVTKTIGNDKKVKFEAGIEAEKKRINEMIFNAAGKKIINAFAANLEDVNFYKTNNVDALGGDKSANDFQCNNIPEYKQVIMEACNRNGISADVIKSRSDQLLGAFGDFKDESTIEGKFRRLQTEVLNANLDPSKIQEGGPKSYSRQEYDKVRFGISQKRDEVKFMSELTDEIMDDPDLSKIINEGLEEGKRPGHAIFKLVSDETNEKVKKILQRIANNHKKVGFYNNLNVALKTSTTEDLRTLIMDTYDVATDMHPGLKAIFRNTELFKGIRAKMENKNHSSHNLLAQLDREPELLKTFFKKRCEGLKAQFSEAICVPTDNLVNLANKEDLNKLLSTVKDQINPVFKDAILCRMPDNKESKSIFTKISFSMGDKLGMADYFKRKVNDGTGPSSRFERFALQYGVKGAANDFLSDMASYGDDQRRPSAEFAAMDKSFLKENNESSTQTTSSQIAERPEVPQVIAPTFSNNYAAPTSTPTVEPIPTQTHKDTRDTKAMLRDFLADEENKADVEKHLSNLSSKDQEELLRLKEQVAADKEKILTLLQESEKLKLRNLEQKVKDVEAASPRARASVNKIGNARNEDRIDDETDEYSDQSDSSNAQANTARETISGTQGSSSSSSSSSSNGRSSSGAERSLASLNMSLQTGQGNTTGTAAASEKGEIIIQSSGTEDVSKEVISYVQTMEPDVEVLKQLKASGMTFKYKVIENGVAVEKEIKVNYGSLSKEARQFLDQKIAVKEARRNYSYNALRLILGLKSQKQL
jgi:hypothetical protein